MPQELENRVTIYISYAQRDRNFFEEFEGHSFSIKLSPFLKSWTSTEVDKDFSVISEVSAQVKLADIIILLISSNFLRTSHLYEAVLEKEEIFQKYSSGLVKIIPVLLKPVDLDNTFLLRYSPLPRDRTVTTWKNGNRDEAFVDVVRGIKEASESLIEVRYRSKLEVYRSFAQEIIEQEYFNEDAEIDILQEKQYILFLEDKDAENINSELCNQYQRKLDELKEAYLEEARNESPYPPFNENSIKRLQQLQQRLGLPDDHISIVLNPIFERIEDELEAKKTELKQAVREKIAQEYPSISDTSLEFLRSKQQSLSIRDRDFNEILRTSRVEESKKRCQEYIEAFNEAFEQEEFIGNSQRQFLRGKQDCLGLSDLEVFAIESQQISQLNADKIDEEVEEIHQDSPNVPDLSFVNLWQDSKNIGWGSYKSSPILFWVFIIFMFFVFSSIVIIPPKDDNNLEKQGISVKPNQDAQTTRNPFKAHIGSESSTKNISEEQVISIIKSWLALKSSAFGATYDTRQAGEITTDYQYQKLIDSVKWLRERKSYVQYKQLKAASKAELFEIFGDKIEIHLNIVEESARYEAGNWYPQTENYSKAYGLKFIDGRWKIAQESRADTEDLFIFRKCFFQEKCLN